MPQQGQDDGGAGDDDDGTEDHRHGPGQPADPVGGGGAEEEAQQHAQRDQPVDPGGGPLQLAQVEGEAALEKDGGDPQRDQRSEGLAQVLAGPDHPEDWADQKAEEGQEHNGRDAQPPADPLCGQTQDDDQGECLGDVVHGAVAVSMEMPVIPVRADN
jgi:hypothetical protein